MDQRKVAVKRLNKELLRMKNDPPCNVSIGPLSGDDLFHWQGTMIGPLDTPYENGIFHFKLDFAENHPFNPPVFQLTTEMFHPDIFSNGFISMSILQKEWSSALTVEKLLLSFISILSDPNPEDSSNPEAANPEAAHCYRVDHQKYQQIAREWTQKYATDCVMETTMATAKEVIGNQLNEIERNSPSGVNIAPIDRRDLFSWQGTIIGPEGSPFQGKSFIIVIRFPLNYPNEPPAINFRTSIFHPKIDECGTIHQNIYKTNWSSDSSTISTAILDIIAMLSNPNPDG